MSGMSERPGSYRPVHPGRPQQRTRGVSSMKLVIVAILCLASWLFGVWCQASGHAETLLAIVPSGLRQTIIDSSETRQREEEQRAQQTKDVRDLLAVQRSILRRIDSVETNVSYLQTEYDESLRTAADDIVHILDRLENLEMLDAARERREGDTNAE